MHPAESIFNYVFTRLSFRESISLSHLVREADLGHDGGEVMEHASVILKLIGVSEHAQARLGVTHYPKVVRVSQYSDKMHVV